MTDTPDMLDASAWELSQRTRSGELGAEELVRAALARVDRLNPVLNALVAMSDTAIDEARALDRSRASGEEPGLLHGLPVGIKDVTEVAGLRTTYGSRLYRDHVPERDALVVRRLRNAGAVILGKTNTPEFATGGNTFNDVYGVTRNPWNPELSAGGSTGGGAAGLASGMIALAEGTDLGGSLRIPASFCGVVGLRPSPGLVPTVPSPYVWDTLQVTGGMGRSAIDVAMFLQATAGPTPEAPLSQPVEGRNFVEAALGPPAKGARVVYCPDVAGIGIDPSVARRCSEAARALDRSGVRVEEREVDLSWAWEPFLALRGMWMVAQQHARLDQLDAFGDNLGGNVRRGLEGTMKDLGAAEAARGRLWHEMRALFADADHLLTPCMAVPPFPADTSHPTHIAGRPMRSYIDWVAPAFVLSLTGLPVASVPCGLDDGGLPVGLQIVGRPRGEESVLALATRIQELLPSRGPPDPVGPR